MHSVLAPGEEAKVARFLAVGIDIARKPHAQMQPAVRKQGKRCVFADGQRRQNRQHLVFEKSVHKSQLSIGQFARTDLAMRTAGQLRSDVLVQALVLHRLQFPDAIVDGGELFVFYAISGIGDGVAGFLGSAAYLGIVVNLILAVFNMIPLAPLDGAAVLSGILPGWLARPLESIQSFGFVILIVLLVLVRLSGRVAWLCRKITPPAAAKSQELVDRKEASGEQKKWFAEFLAEDPARRDLPKKEQFAESRRWREAKGLNWKGSADPT